MNNLNNARHISRLEKWLTEAHERAKTANNNDDFDELADALCEVALAEQEWDNFMLEMCDAFPVFSA